MSGKMYEKRPEEDARYHDTWRLLKKYRDVTWSLELSIRQVKNQFRIDYDCSIEDFLESIYMAGADLGGTDIENHARCIERSYKMLTLLENSVNLLRTHHQSGEVYYWILYYSFLSPQKLKNVEEIIEALHPHIRDISFSTYYPDNYEVLSTDAALRAERITCRLRHLIYATTSIKKEEYLRSAETMQGIEISENDGILEIKLPCLLPKRRQRQSTEFLLDPFTSALSDYAAHHTMPQFQHCVVCFSHIYAQELPERRIRDYDNLELKQFLDVAASFILTDDNGLLCDAYNTTELGEEDCTRLFLMDSTQFPAWLAERQNGVKSISDF